MKAFIVTLWTLTLFCCFHVTSGKGNALLDAKTVAKGIVSPKETFCILYNSAAQHLPPSIDANSHKLLDLGSKEGCTSDDYNNVQANLKNTVVGVSRGNCTFVEKARIAESFGASAVLVVDYHNASSSDLPIPGGNGTEYKAIANTTVATITWLDYKSILSLPHPVQVSLYAPPVVIWDSNMVVIVLASTALVMIGAGWGAFSEYKAQRNKHRRGSSSSTSQEENSNNNAQSDNDVFGVCEIAFLIVCLCVVIVLLYFFYDYMVYFFIATFCIAGSSGLYHCLLPMWTRVVAINYDIPLNRLPCIRTKVKLRSFLLYMPCLTLAIFWAVERHSAHAWILQDLLGATFCIFFIRTWRLPNLKIIGIFLVMLLVYDVFFVFISPLFTNDGNSIMETVATGGRSHSSESIPMVFQIPILSSSPFFKCRDRSYSLLGFGDVILPGILVAYNAVYDVHRKTKMTYFISSSIGYLLGMIVCMISLVFMKSGQPALLYLVPGTLVSTILVACFRKELGSLIKGKHLTKAKTCGDNEAQLEEADAGSNASLEEEEQNLIN